VKHSFILDFSSPTKGYKCKAKGMPTFYRRHFHFYFSCTFWKNWSYFWNQENCKAKS